MPGSVHVTSGCHLPASLGHSFCPTGQAWRQQRPPGWALVRVKQRLLLVQSDLYSVVSSTRACVRGPSGAAWGLKDATWVLSPSGLTFSLSFSHCKMGQWEEGP